MKKKIIQIEPDLFTAFVKKQVAEYKQPERKGVPKGERIGLSKKKYEVSLYMVTDLQHRDIKDRTGVSESLIRKWRTEDDFRKQLERNQKQFASYVINAILRFNDVNLGYLARYYDRPGKEDYAAVIDIFEKFLPDGPPREDNTLITVEPSLDLDILTDDVKVEILKQLNKTGKDYALAFIDFRKSLVSSLCKGTVTKDKDLLLVDLHSYLTVMEIVYRDIIPLLSRETLTPKEKEFTTNMVTGMSITVKEMADSIQDTLKQDPRFEKVLETIGREE